MKNRTLLYSLYFFLLFLPFVTLGQYITPSLLSSSGDVFTKINASMEWSIGELCTETYKTPNLIMTQGLHQGEYLFYSVNENVNNHRIVIYPNPTSDFVSIYSGIDKQTMTARLFDIFGKVLLEQDFIGECRFNLSVYSDGLYIIGIIDKNNTFRRSFKIEKINSYK